MYTDERLEQIFIKEGGDCAYCRKVLAWKNYGRVGSRGAWQVDHRIPVSRGGTNHLNNLSAACVPCNMEKGDMTARTFMRSRTPVEREVIIDVDLGAWLKVAGLTALTVLGLKAMEKERPARSDVWADWPGGK